MLYRSYHHHTHTGSTIKYRYLNTYSHETQIIPRISFDIVQLDCYGNHFYFISI